MQRKAIQRIVVALVALGAIGAQAAGPITIINADFEQDEAALIASGAAWMGGVTNWVQSNCGVQWDNVGSNPSNILVWVNGGGSLKTHALANDLSSFEVASNQSITVTFDLARGGNPAPSYAVDVFSTDGDILLATTGDIDITGLTPLTSSSVTNTLQWLGATPSTNGFDIVISQPGGQILLDNVAATNDDPDPTPQAPVWVADPIIIAGGLIDHPFSGSLAGLASDPNWDVVIYSRDPGGDPWLTVAPDGTLGGTPSSSGPQDFTVIASDGTLSSTAILSLDIGIGTAPVWDPNPVDLATPAFVGTPYSNSVASYVIEPDGEPITYAIVTGPAWLSIDSNTGEITGTPTEVGTNPNVFTMSAADIDGSDVATVNITVTDGDGKIIVVLDAGGLAEGTGQTLSDLSTGGESFSGTAVFSATGSAGWLQENLTEDMGRWGDNEFDLEPASGVDGTYAFGSLTVGSEWTVYASWRSQDQVNNAPAVPYTINGGDPIIANHRLANPNDLTLHDGSHDVWFMELGTATVGVDGTVVVSVSASVIDDGLEWTVCDAIALVAAGAPPPSDPVTDLTISGPVSGGTGMVLSWTALDKGTYGVETNSNLVLGDWQTFMTGLSKQGGGIITVTNTIGPDQVFYQIITE